MQNLDGDLAGCRDAARAPLTHLPPQPAPLLAILSLSNVFSLKASGQTRAPAGLLSTPG